MDYDWYKKAEDPKLRLLRDILLQPRQAGGEVNPEPKYLVADGGQAEEVPEGYVWPPTEKGVPYAPKVPGMVRPVPNAKPAPAASAKTPPAPEPLALLKEIIGKVNPVPLAPGLESPTTEQQYDILAKATSAIGREISNRKPPTEKTHKKSPSEGGAGSGTSLEPRQYGGRAIPDESERVRWEAGGPVQLGTMERRTQGLDTMWASPLSPFKAERKPVFAQEHGGGAIEVSRPTPIPIDLTGAVQAPYEVPPVLTPEERRRQDYRETSRQDFSPTSLEGTAEKILSDIMNAPAKNIFEGATPSNPIDLTKPATPEQIRKNWGLKFPDTGIGGPYPFPIEMAEGGVVTPIEDPMKDNPLKRVDEMFRSVVSDGAKMGDKLISRAKEGPVFPPYYQEAPTELNPSGFDEERWKRVLREKNLPAPAPSPQENIRGLVSRIAREYEVPESLALAMAHGESGFNPKAVGKAQEQGLFQLKPQTIIDLKKMGHDINDPTDPEQNTRGGLKWLITKPGSTFVDKLMAYNGAGPAAREYAQNVVAKAKELGWQPGPEEEAALAKLSTPVTTPTTTPAAGTPTPAPTVPPGQRISPHIVEIIRGANPFKVYQQAWTESGERLPERLVEYGGMGGGHGKPISVGGMGVYTPGVGFEAAPWGKKFQQNIQNYYKIDKEGNVISSVALDENDPDSLAMVKKEGLVSANDPRILSNRAAGNINLGAAVESRKEWAKKTAGDYAEEWKKAKSEGLAAQGNLYRIAQIRKALGAGYQGKLASLKASAGAYYEAITGSPAAAAQETQVAQAIANRIALTMVGAQVEGGGMPANMFSEADRNFVVQANANPNLTPEANARLLDMAERVEKFKQIRATAMTEYIGLNGGIPDAGMYPYVEKRVAEAFAAPGATPNAPSSPAGSAGKTQTSTSEDEFVKRARADKANQGYTDDQLRQYYRNKYTFKQGE